MRKKYTNEEMISIAKSKNLEIINFGYMETPNGRKRKIANCICFFHKNKGIQQIKVEALRNNNKPCHYCNHSKLKETFVEEMNEINPDIEILSEYKNWDTIVKCKCKICGYIWDGNPGSLLYGSGCRNCFYDHKLWDKRGRKTTEEFKIQMMDVNPNYEVVGEYQGSHELIKMHCKVCDTEWESHAVNLLREEAGCPVCSLRKKRKIFSRSHNDFLSILNSVNPYIEPKDNYINERTKILMHCNKHNYDFYSAPRTFITKKSLGCPYCLHENGIPGGKLPEDVYKSLVEEYGYVFKGVSYKGNKNRAIISFMCKKHIEKGIQETLWSTMSEGKECCGWCNGHSRTIDDLQDIINEKFDSIEVFGEYTGTRNRVTALCKKHNYEWKPFVYNLLSGFGCPICGREKSGLSRRIDPEETKTKLDKLYPEIHFLHYPQMSNDSGICECKICGENWSTSYNNLMAPGFHVRCPKCNMPLAEKKIATILDNWGIEYKSQYKFKDCKLIFELPFDFYIPLGNICIEFDGEQHYYPITFGNMSEEQAKEEFEKNQIRDNLKTNFCQYNGIKLIRIPYWNRDNIELILFDNFVKYGLIEQI